MRREEIFELIKHCLILIILFLRTLSKYYNFVFVILYKKQNIHIQWLRQFLDLVFEAWI